ncbi:UV-endonuclease UvdE [Aureobasidium namibiae CBS 147.97]|uniref:UV-endonuclease UvdE n=1 Tax=Aureobasidium namibiae CBS 147.97 TaxID=1043004 RepID=A0A074WDW6_9PEZI|nr:UV-endonuclease UvdE [Aureobasidium namibiae CBS 147.97]KEQ71305.1 UV-endonuclease UvdE [Aureobasidium namibiae CBS 147.97]
MDDPEDEDFGEADEAEVNEASRRPPPVNSDYLPLPWKGRLGYACLNTYLRYSTPPVFASRTCRIASILEHRHPLRDPNEPEHPTKNRPDREQPASIERGQKYVEAIGLANARDLIKMLRWNDKYGIKFMRLSSEMFPFASHEEYGYKLTPFAAETLAEVGKVVAELGHRVTTHPGQFTQLGSPRKSVIDNALRDLEFHDEMLSLLKLPEQMNRDAVMILHLGGVFGDRAATLDRFRENYKTLPQGVKNRLVLENDDVSWSVHELLPICEELNIPMVLDYHHHNIIFDKEQIREGTKDICDLYPRIKATWDRKNIKQKMHYSEPTPAAITGTQRRKHNPRVATLPPCADDMDLMIEAKDKEQAVFELMRTFKLPGYDTFNEIIPHVREDDNKAAMQASNKKKATPKKKGKQVKDEDEDMEDDAGSVVDGETAALIPEEEVGMGGPEGRVYWPPGMEDYLRPKKREVKPKATPGSAKKATPAQKKKALADAIALEAAVKEQHESDEEAAEEATAATKKAKEALKARAAAARAKSDAMHSVTAPPTAAAAATAPTPAAAAAAAAAKPAPKRKAPAPNVKKEKEEKVEVTPPTSDDSELELNSSEDDAPINAPKRPAPRAGARSSGRASKAKVSYQEADVSMDED